MKIVLLGKSGCMPCVYAKNALEKKGLKFDYIDGGIYSDTVSKLLKVSKTRIVPQLFIDGKFINRMSRYLISYIKSLPPQ